MPTSRFIQRFGDRITGVLSGFDRLVLRGSLLAIPETAGTWVFYPPIGERGVRLSAEDAIRVAEKILADAHGRS